MPKQLRFWLEITLIKEEKKSLKYLFPIREPFIQHAMNPKCDVLFSIKEITWEQTIFLDSSQKCSAEN